MGYTNYHYQKENFNDEEWDYILHHKNKIMEHFGDVEIEEDISDKDTIFLNGVGENSHETFILSKEKRELEDWEKKDSWVMNSYKEKGAFRFCKTNGKPYDSIVWNVLLKAYEIAPHKVTIQNDNGEVFDSTLGEVNGG
jgi:hypothetical protein